MGKIAKNYIYNLFYHIFVMFVPLVTAPYLARTLGADGTGIYGYVSSMTTMICTFVMLGIYNYGNRQIAYVRDDKKYLTAVFWQIMSCRLIIALFGTIIYFAITMAIGRYKNLFALYYTYMLAYFLDPTWIFVGVEDMKWALLKNVMTKMLAVMGIFTLVKSETDLPIYILIQGLSVLVSNILSFTQLGRYVEKPRLDFSNFKKDLFGSIALFLPSIGTTIYTQCDKIMIELMTSKSNEVSYYDYSEKIVTIPLAFITAISTVMMPRIANEFKKGNGEKISSLLNQSARFSMLMALPMTFGLIAISDKFVPWYLGDDFIPTIHAIKLIAPIIITNTLIGVSGSQYFTATNQIKVLIISQFSAAGLNVVINSLLIPYFGFKGAAIATMITSFTCAAFQYVFMLRQVKMRGLLKSIIRYALISIIMYLIIRLTTYNSPATPYTTIIQVIIGMISFVVMLFIVKDEQLFILINKFNRLFVKK